jgi:fluoride ion exporter CrcB/FEX
MPKTRIGKWSVGLLLLFGLFVLTIILMQRRAGDPLLVIPGLCAAASGVATFVTALIGLFKQKDRTFLVVFCAVIGFLVSLMVIFEVIEGVGYRLNH